MVIPPKLKIISRLVRKFFLYDNTSKLFFVCQVKFLFHKQFPVERKRRETFSPFYDKKQQTMMKSIATLRFHKLFVIKTKELPFFSLFFVKSCKENETFLFKRHIPLLFCNIARSGQGELPYMMFPRYLNLMSKIYTSRKSGSHGLYFPIKMRASTVIDTVSCSRNCSRFSSSIDHAKGVIARKVCNSGAASVVV